MQATRAVETGDASLTLVGGVESMSRAPWVLLKPEKALPAGDATLHSTTLGWRMVNPRMPDQWTISLGESTEKLAGIHGITREAAGRVRAAQPPRHRGGVGRRLLRRLGHPGAGDRARARRERAPRQHAREARQAQARVRAATASVTAGNASPLNDGAGALWIGDEAAGDELGREPLARIAGRGVHAVDPDVFGIGPVEAAERALARAGHRLGRPRAVELNEAFAAQSLACLARWPELDPEIVNVNGGAIAIGHPLGASGARILGTLAYELRRRGGGYGLAAICIGVGQGLAMVLHA